MGQALVMLVGLVVVGVISYVKHLHAQQRAAELAAYCASQGWRFSAVDLDDLVNRWAGPPFDTGRRRRVRNVVSAEVDGRPMVAFDYSYTVRQGKSTRTYEYAVVALGMPCPLPELHVAPEGVFSRLGTVLGMADIDLESEDFNRQFRVRCPNPKFAHDVLTARTMHALLAMGPVEFRFAGPDALCYELGHLDPTGILERVHALRTVLAGIPSFVWRDRGTVA